MKENYYYAQLNDENVCVALSMLVGEVIQENMIEIKSYNTALMGKKYENGEWVEGPKPVLTAAEKRELEYRNRLYKEDGTPLIEYRGVLYNCDSALAQVKVYEEEDKYSGGSFAKELGMLWAKGKEYIRNLEKEL